MTPDEPDRPPGDRADDNTGAEAERTDVPDDPASVPDDPRALERDLLALQREQRASRRRARWRTLLLPGTGEAFRIPALLLALGLLVVLAYAALPILVRTDNVSRPPSAPLANPDVMAGLVGGLLPEGQLDTPAGLTSTRELDRPTALLLVPAPCDCEPTLADLVTRLSPTIQQIRVVTDPTQDPGGEVARSLRSAPGRGQIDAASDVSGALRAYEPVGVTVVLVGPDGVVVDVIRRVEPGTPLPALRDLRAAPEQAP